MLLSTHKINDRVSIGLHLDEDSNKFIIVIGQAAEKKQNVVYLYSDTLDQIIRIYKKKLTKNNKEILKVFYSKFTGEKP